MVKSIPAASNTVESIAFSPDGTGSLRFRQWRRSAMGCSVSENPAISLRESSGPYSVQEVTIHNKLGEQNSLFRFVLRREVFFISFSPDGGQIILMTVGAEPNGLNVRIATWGGTPRRK